MTEKSNHKWHFLIEKYCKEDYNFKYRTYSKRRLRISTAHDGNIVNRQSKDGTRVGLGGLWPYQFAPTPHPTKCPTPLSTNGAAHYRSSIQLQSKMAAPNAWFIEHSKITPALQATRT